MTADMAYHKTKAVTWFSQCEEMSTSTTYPPALGGEPAYHDASQDSSGECLLLVVVDRRYSLL